MKFTQRLEMILNRLALAAYEYGEHNRKHVQQAMEEISALLDAAGVSTEQADRWLSLNGRLAILEDHVQHIE